MADRKHGRQITTNECIEGSKVTHGNVAIVIHNPLSSINNLKGQC